MGMFDLGGMYEYQERRRDEFERLALDPCTIEAEVGDTVVVSCGPIGRGFPWERMEAKVLVVGQSSYKIQLPDVCYGMPCQKEDIRWIHPGIVTDVIKQEARSEQ